MIFPWYPCEVVPMACARRCKATSRGRGARARGPRASPTASSIWFWRSCRGRWKVVSKAWSQLPRAGWWWLEIYDIGRLLDHQAKLGFIRVSDPNMTLKFQVSELVLAGGLEHEFYDFPFSWECHHPNWRTPSFFRGVGIPPTRGDWPQVEIVYLRRPSTPWCLLFFSGEIHSVEWWISLWKLELTMEHIRLHKFIDDLSRQIGPTTRKPHL